MPLFAILGGVGLSFDSAFAADYVLDESFCENEMNGSWNNAVSPRLGGTCTADEYSLESGNTLEIPFHVELRMMSAQPTLGISSGATLNIAGELTIDQRSDDMDMMREREWQGNPAIGNFGTINALDYSEVSIRPDRDSIFNSGVITIRGDSKNLERGISGNSPGSVTNYNDDIPNFVEFTVQETLDQSTCEGAMRAEWNSNTCTMPNWVIFKSGAELTIPSDVTWILAPSDGGYNVSVDEGATIINDGTIIIDSGDSYPFYNQGTFINNGLYRIETAGFTGFSTTSTGTTENYGTFESSDMVRYWALYQSGGSFSNFGTIDVPDYLIASGVNIIEPNVVVQVTDADGDGYDSIEFGGADCNDADDTTYPGAPETVIGLDQNCDGAFLMDADNDGFASIASGGNDCNDADDTTYPGALETVIGLDQNCDSLVFEGNNVPQPPVQNNEFELTAQLCEDVALDEINVQWTEPILTGYEGTCIVSNEYEGTDSPGETIIVSQDVILVLRNNGGAIAEGAMMQVNGALVLENTLFANMGLLHIDGYLHIDEDSTFYNIGNAQTITYQGQTTELTGMGELIVRPNADVLLEGELKNSGLIDNAGTFDINMCSGSVDNIGGSTITNVANGVVNEIACDVQPNNPPANPGADNTPPVINVPANTQLQVETAGSLATQFFRSTAVDETDGNVAVDCTFPQNNKYRVGTTTVTCTAVDNAGNDSQKSFSVTVVVADGDAITCGAGTELFNGECRAIPQRVNPTVDVPNVPVPQVQQTQTTIGLIATVTDTYENGVTTLDIQI